MKVRIDNYSKTKYNVTKRTESSTSENPNRREYIGSRNTVSTGQNVSFTGLLDIFKKKKSKPQATNTTKPESQATNTPKPQQQTEQEKAVSDDTEKSTKITPSKRNEDVIEKQPIEPESEEYMGEGNPFQGLSIAEAQADKTVEEKKLSKEAQGKKTPDTSAVEKTPKLEKPSKPQNPEKPKNPKKPKKPSTLEAPQKTIEPPKPKNVLDEDDKLLKKAIDENDYNSCGEYLNKKLNGLKTLKETEDTVKHILEISEALGVTSYQKRIVKSELEYKVLKTCDHLDKSRRYNDEMPYIKKRFNEFVDILKNPENNNYENRFFTKLYFKALDFDTQMDNLEKLLDINFAPDSHWSFLYFCPKELLDKYTKLAFKRIFDENPDLKDGIYTFEDFTRVTSSPYFEGYMYKEEMNEDCETLIDAFIGLSPKNQEEKVIQELILEEIKNHFDFKTDKLGRNYAYKAVEAENLVMIDFLVNQYKDNFFKKSNFGVSAVDLVKKSENPEIKQYFEGRKLYCPMFYEAASEGLLVPMKELYQTGLVDVNYSTYGSNALARAIDKGHSDVLKFLLSLDDIKMISHTEDKKVYGNRNILKYLIDKNEYKILEKHFLNVDGKHLGLERKFEDKGWKYNVYEYILKKGSWLMMKSIMQHPEANPNIKGTYYKEPLVFNVLKENASSLDMYKSICLSGKVDFSLKNSEGQTAIDIVNKMSVSYFKKEFLDVTNRALIRNFINDIKKRVDEDGYLTLTNINEILDHPSVGKFIGEKFSDTEETLAHLLADVETNYGNMFDVLNAAKKIVKIQPDLFLKKDIYSQSALERVVFAENTILLEYLLKNIYLPYDEEKNLIQLANSVGKQEIIDIISNSLNNKRK